MRATYLAHLMLLELTALIIIVKEYKSVKLSLWTDAVMLVNRKKLTWRFECTIFINRCFQNWYPFWNYVIFPCNSWNQLHKKNFEQRPWEGSQLERWNPFMRPKFTGNWLIFISKTDSEIYSLLWNCSVNLFHLARHDAVFYHSEEIHLYEDVLVNSSKRYLTATLRVLTCGSKLKVPLPQI
jgi:hypothetical protein